MLVFSVAGRLWVVIFCELTGVTSEVNVGALGDNLIDENCVILLII